MKWPLIFSVAVGAAFAIGLASMSGFSEICQSVTAAGWGIVAVIAFHLVQMVFSSLPWQWVTLGPTVPSFATFLRLRWIREGVNNLLPVAQIGGEFVGARLLALRGVSLGAASAGVTVDLTLEMLTQIAFTLVGIGLLAIGQHDTNVVHWLIGGTIFAALVGGAFVLAQCAGLLWLVEKGLLWLARQVGCHGLEQAAGLHASIITLYKSPLRLAVAGGSHFVSWLLGGLEVMLALYVVGVTVDLRQGLIIESLGQACKSVGFAIPGALGVQEGGYILVCGLLGVGAPSAIVLSLLKRAREIVLGVPGLLVWQLLEGRRMATGSFLPALKGKPVGRSL
jgi:putative membrane protein